MVAAQQSDSGRQTQLFGEADATAGALDGLTVAGIGYGHLARSIALNLRDSGVAVVVGNRDDDYIAPAETDGFSVLPISEAVERCDIAYFLLPDEVVPDVFPAVADSLKAGNMIAFASGYNLAHSLIEPPANVDVCLLAPRMLGVETRELYESGEGFFSFVSVENDFSGRAWERLLGLASAVGSLRKGALQLSAADEATLDLFIEQGLGAYFGTALQLSFQLGVEAGLPAEALVLEMYMSGEMARTIGAFARDGFYRSVGSHGPTARFGGFIRSLELDRAGMERRLREALDDIRNGGFASKFQAEKDSGYPSLGLIDKIIDGSDPQSAAESALRKLLENAGGPAK
jgi:ketol-acid reductoisomerase